MGGITECYILTEKCCSTSMKQQVQNIVCIKYIRLLLQWWICTYLSKFSAPALILICLMICWFRLALVFCSLLRPVWANGLQPFLKKKDERSNCQCTILFHVVKVCSSGLHTQINRKLEMHCNQYRVSVPIREYSTHHIRANIKTLIPVVHTVGIESLGTTKKQKLKLWCWALWRVYSKHRPL